MCASLGLAVVSGLTIGVQDPRRQAATMAAKFPGASVAVVMPSRLEACFACFDHFLGRVTASGEPLGHDGQVQTEQKQPAPHQIDALRAEHPCSACRGKKCPD